MSLSFPEQNSENERYTNRKNLLIVFLLVSTVSLFYFGLLTHDVLLVEPRIYWCSNIVAVVLACCVSVLWFKYLRFSIKDWFAALGLFFGISFCLHIICSFSILWVLHGVFSVGSNSTVSIEAVSYVRQKGSKFACERTIDFEQYRGQIFGSRICNVKPEIFDHLKKGDEMVLEGKRSFIGFSPDLSKLQ